MRVHIIGGGPAGLYFGILMRKQGHEVVIRERNASGETFGWGVVFSDATLGNFERADAETHRQILATFRHWDDIDTWFGGRKITSSGHGFCGIARIRSTSTRIALAARLSSSRMDRWY